MTAVTQAKSGRGSGNRLVYYLLIGVATLVVTLALMALSYGSGQPSDNDLSLPLVLHLATVIPALPLGAYILWAKKGGSTHRMLGRIWIGLMLTTSLSSLGFAFSFIHVFTVLVFVSIPIALWRIRVGDVEGHRRALEGMYIGLVIAGAFSFIPGRFLGSLLFG